MNQMKMSEIFTYIQRMYQTVDQWVHVELRNCNQNACGASYGSSHRFQATENKSSKSLHNTSALGFYAEDAMK